MSESGMQPYGYYLEQEPRLSPEYYFGLSQYKPLTK